MTAARTGETGVLESAPTSPDGKRIWQAARAPIFVAVVIVVAAILLLVTNGGTAHGDLDPRSAEPGGAQALARLLTEQGVRVVGVRTFADAEKELSPGAELLVTEPALVEPGHLAELRRHAGEAVMIGARQDTLDTVLPGVFTMPDSEVGVRSPDCTVAAAVAAGTATLGGVGYQARQAARVCYSGSLLQLGPTTLLGSGAPLTNQRLATEGNAALSLRLLGRSSKLVWYLPSPADTSAGVAPRPFLDLVPRRWLFGAVELGVAVVLFALWRGRRLGPVVDEPLPVVVRAAETVEGRARLYRRSRSSGHAAGILRQAAVDRLCPALGLGAATEPSVVVSAVAARSGRSAAEVRALLYGPAPENDAALVRLADEIDRLTREVR
jgi:uncharacterized protein DUF4350